MSYVTLKMALNYGPVTAQFFLPQKKTIRNRNVIFGTKLQGLGKPFSDLSMTGHGMKFLVKVSHYSDRNHIFSLILFKLARNIAGIKMLPEFL